MADTYQKLVKQMSEELFSFLNEVGARYPERDIEYNVGLETVYLRNVVEKRLPQLEKQRLDFLSREYDPGNQWWGSMVTED